MDDDTVIMVPREWLSALLEEIVALRLALGRLEPRLAEQLEREIGPALRQGFSGKVPQS